MIYLLTQMVLALLVAVVLGGALGWLLHRTTQTQASTKLRKLMQRQHQQLSQLNAEIQMLTDDYAELQHRSREEIRELREANQQIPRLNANLERSQALVSQMIKRHESQLRDLNKQNESLSTQLKAFEAREQSVNQQQAALDNARREMGLTEPSLSARQTPEVTDTPAQAVMASSSTEIAEGATAPGDVDSIATGKDRTSPTEERAGSEHPDHRSPDDRPSTDSLISNARNRSSWASAKVLVEQDHSPVELEAASIGTPSTVADDNSPAGRPVIFLDANTDAPVARKPKRLTERALASASNAKTQDADQIEEPFTTVARQANTYSPALESRTNLVDHETDSLDRPLDADEQLLSEFSLHEGISPFEPVDQHDDLQQIVGIGPQTEQVLNQLGITSYAQLARLNHHEIETIANALQLGAERIEQDDWVGSARRQLEDVLEDL